MSKPRLQRRITAALLGALLCLSAPLSIHIGGIPLSLATLGVYLCALLAGGFWGSAAVTVYLCLGALGVPVFAGFVGGIQVFAGPTGGFLLGYIPCTLLAGFLCARFPHRPLLQGAFLFVGTMMLYVCGAVWLSVSTDIPFFTAFLTGCIPFLPFDVIKIIAALILARKVLHKL